MPVSVADRQRKYRERLRSVKEREQIVSNLRIECREKLINLRKDLKWAEETKRPVRRHVEWNDTDRARENRRARNDFQRSIVRWLEMEEERLNTLILFCDKAEEEWRLVVDSLNDTEYLVDFLTFVND